MGVCDTIDVGTCLLIEQEKEISIDKPERNRSAYNIFFKKELASICQKCAIDKKRPNFEELTRSIAKKWKNLDPKNRQHINYLAAEDKIRYEKEIKEYEIACEIDAKSTNHQSNWEDV